MSALRVLTYVGSGFVLLLALAFCAGRATAHDDHDWMRSDGYRSSSGEHCCSPNRDCNVVPDSELELTPQGWRYLPTGEVIADRDTFRSRDPQGRHWRCAGAIYWYGNMRAQKTRCLFVAPGTT